MTDLDALLSRAIDKANEEARIKQARKRLVEDRLGPTEREELQAIVNHYDETRLWNNVACVALVQEQHCLTCEQTGGSLFKGWMLEQAHRVASKTRRLTAIKEPMAGLPLHVEVHRLKPAAHCPACIGHFVKGKG